MLHSLAMKKRFCRDTTCRRGSLSLGLCRGAVTGTKLDIVAKLVIQLWLAALGTQGVVCDTLRSAVSCPSTLLAHGNLTNGHEKTRWVRAQYGVHGTKAESCQRDL